MQDDRNAVINHTEAWDLLPWLVNGTLEPAAHSLVNRHVSDCLTCRRELLQQKALYELVQHSETVHISPKASFDTVMGRIDSDVDPDWRTIPWHWAAEAIDFSRRALRLLSSPLPAVGIVAGLALIAIVFVSPITAPDQSPDFRTLGDEQMLTQGGTAVLQLVFTEQTSDQEIDEIVKGLGGQIIKDPTGAGVYTVQFPVDQTHNRITDGVLQQLASDSRIRFVGQAFKEASGKP
jgi:hypothetical protein